MPLQIIAEYGNWHRVIDSNDQGGWVHCVLLSGIRTVIVAKDLLALRTNPSETAYVRAKLEQNVIALTRNSRAISPIDQHSSSLCE